MVGCRRAGDKVRIEVWDSGIGIAREDIPRIFQEYYQAQDHKHPEGYGLGLAIVQRLGKTLNHPVNVRSTPGKGSCFSIEMSASRAKADEADRPKLPVAKDYAILGGTVLVIEDDTFVPIRIRIAVKIRRIGCSFRCKWQCCSGSRHQEKYPPRFSVVRFEPSGPNEWC